jgi:hypothetical protein
MIRHRKSRNFRSFAVIDFEYEIGDGGLPLALCLVAYIFDENFRHIRTVRMWRGEFGATPPFDIGPDALIIGYSLWAEMPVSSCSVGNFLYICSTSTPLTSQRPTFFSHMSQTKSERSHARNCRMPVEPMASRVGKVSTKVTWQRTSAKVTGENTARLLRGGR